MAKIRDFLKLIFESMLSNDANKKYVTGHVSEMYEIVRMIFEQFLRTYLLPTSLLPAHPSNTSQTSHPSHAVLL